MNHVLIGLASNWQPKNNMCRAFSHIKQNLAIIEISPVISGPSRDGSQSIFHNALIYAKTERSFGALREYFSFLEEDLGRQKGSDEITIDIDLLAYKGEDSELFLSPDLEEGDVTYLAKKMNMMPVSFYKKDKSDILYHRATWRLGAVEHAAEAALKS